MRLAIGDAEAVLFSLARILFQVDKGYSPIYEGTRAVRKADSQALDVYIGSALAGPFAHQQRLPFYRIDAHHWLGICATGIGCPVLTHDRPSHVFVLRRL